MTFQGILSSNYILSIYTDILKDLPANNQSNEINLNNSFYFYIPIYLEKCKSGQYYNVSKLGSWNFKSLPVFFSLVCVQCSEGKYAYNNASCKDCPEQASCTNGILKAKPGIIFFITKWKQYIILN